MKLQLLLLVIGVCCALSTQAQDPKHYAYDAAGNRISRLVVKSLSEEPGKDDEIGKDDLVEELDTKKQDEADLWKAYPNPSDGIVNLELSLKEPQLVRVNVFNMAGRVLLLEEFPSSERSQIDIGSIASGEYILEVSAGDERRSWSIVKR